MRELRRCTEQQNKMVFFATRFLKQLEQNDKGPKQITSRYLFVNNLRVLFNKGLLKNSYLLVEPRKKEYFVSALNRILAMIFGVCVKLKVLCLGAANPAKTFCFSKSFTLMEGG